MTPREMEDFLAAPLVAVLTTLRPDGSPHVSPVWFEYEDGRFYVWAGADAVKVRNLKLDPRAAICIATEQEPYRYVIAEGACAIETSEVPSRCFSISRRYYGPERAATYVKSDLAAGDSVVLVLSPTRLFSESSA